MNKQYTVGIVALAVGILAIGGGTIIMNQRDTDKNSMNHSQMSDSDQMTTRLSTLQGDAFDAAFINDMSEHHAGAVAMAKLVDTEAKNPQIQVLAKAIITTQTKELNDMKAWAEKWGYDYEVPGQAAIDEMTSGMKGQSGDDLDKAFLTDMIGHHMSAINMAVLTSTNAKHQEIKTLGQNIQTTQASEIQLMRDYARTAGYTIDSMSGGHDGGGGSHSM